MDAPRVAVAASGGRDSTALLHCTARAAAALGVPVTALHVHHGLRPEADDWLRQVQAQCRRWGVAFMSRRLQTAPARGESVEAWARRERYLALAEMARQAGCGLVLLAHHRRDQAETWLLQALRSAGPAGLAAMPLEARREGLVWARPWLAQPRTAIEAYVRRHRLRYVDDDSNADPRFARNRLRAVVWPALVQAFADAETALAGAAVRAQEAAALAAEVAAADLPPLRQGKALCLQRWLELGQARRRNVLRAWLAQELPAAAPESLLARLCSELPTTRAGSWPAPAAALRLHRGLLAVHRPRLPRGVPAEPLVVDLDRVGVWRLPTWHGRFVVAWAREGGVVPEALHQAIVRPRSGGERFRLAPNAAARSLKKQFQASGRAAWEREGPLLYTAAGELLFVPGLGIEAGRRAVPGRPQLAVAWVHDDDDPTGLRQADG
jgi:tRNA(Ile)-lysidine synthase